MLKKLLSFIFLISFAVSLLPSAVIANTQVTIQVDGVEVGKVPAPVLSNGVEMFPFGEIFAAAGFKVFINDPVEAGYVGARVLFGGKCFEAQAYSSSANVFEDVDGGCGGNWFGTIEIDPTPVVIGTSSTGVPLNYFNYDIGLSLAWDEQQGVISVNTHASKPQSLDGMLSDQGVYLKINDPRMMLSNYEAIHEAPVDASGNVTPIVREGRTLLPISALIGALGGTASWDNTERKVTIQLNGNTVDVWINKKDAVVNGIKTKLEVSPTITNGRTMLPLRFVTENLGLEVLWDNENKIIVVYQPWFKREMILDANMYSGFFPLLISEEVIPEKVAPISSTPITGYLEGYYPLETDGFKAQVPEAWTFMYSEVKYKINSSDLYSIDAKATPTEEEYEFNPISEYMASHGIYSKMRIVPYDQNINHTDFLKRTIFNFKPNEFSPVSVGGSDYALMNKSYNDSIYDRSSWDLIVFKNDVCYILTSSHEINSAGIWPAEVHRANIKNFRAQLEILYGSFEITDPNIVFAEVVKNELPVSR